MSEFGGLVRDAREKLGLSHHRVAELIGRGTGIVRAWERGRTIPSDPHVVSSLAAVLAIDENELFLAAGLSPPDRRPTRTIEQELATIAPPRRAASSEVEAASSVITEGTPAVDTPSSDDAPGDEPSSAPVLAPLADIIEQGREKIAEIVESVKETPRRERRTAPAPTPSPATIPVTPAPVAPSGTYMDDPEERWSYRLRSVWTAAGVGVLGMLLLWAGSRALDAFGEAWDSLLAGL